ncbi:hypothetical protein JAB8_38380 [Janthinobacterium sp. HH106]|nr:hypothetical protein JAB8_38380 [Janthinobacterium sp. HH106]
MPEPIFIDPLSATSLHVVSMFNGIELASATAFTIESNKTPYLVTNWHVVTGRKPDTGDCIDKIHAAIPNILRVRFHTKGKFGQWSHVDIQLFDEDQHSLWQEHPLGKEVDVVAIPLPPEVTAQVAIYPLDLALAAVDMIAMPAFPVSVIGYPLGLSAGQSWPIWKTGHIASDPDIDFEPGRPVFLIDATTRSGMSGSPVVLRLHNYERSDGSHVMHIGRATKFIGIYSGRIHEDSEVGKVWRPSVLSEILNR